MKYQILPLFIKSNKTLPCIFLSIALGLFLLGSANAQTEENNSARCHDFDWGDAPDNCHTTASQGGPQHMILSCMPYIGDIIPDPEPDGQCCLMAQGDGSDEEGVISSLIFDEGDPAVCTIRICNPTYEKVHLYGWIDWDLDGPFEWDERRHATIDPNTNREVVLNFGSVPFFSTQNMASDTTRTYMRLRVSTNQGSVRTPTGYAPDGEVEDHLVTILADVLPVELSDFKVTEIDNKRILLNWTTHSESNNDYFVVERSLNSVDFNAIGRGSGKGNSDLENHYAFIDELPYSGNNFYRLKQIDLDGSMVLSKIVSLRFQLKEADMTINVFPNPATDRITIHSMLPLGERIRFEIVDISGRTIKEMFHPVEPGILSRGTMDISNIIPGHYFMKATHKNGFKKVVPIYVID